MTDTTTEAPAEEAPKATPAPMFDAPKDTPEADATGYAVYDRSIGQYVTAVTKDKPSSTDARKAVREGHSYKVVRV